jgi:signal transduction histidine kinase
MTGLSPSTGSIEERSQGGGSAHAVPPLRAPYLRTAILPSAVIAWLCTLAAAIALLVHASPHVDHLVLVGITGGVLLMLVVAIVAAWAAGRQIDARVRTVRLVSRRGQAELERLVDTVTRGEQPAPLVPVPVRPADGDPFKRLENELEQSHYQAGQAVLRVAERTHGGRSDQRVEIFVNLARRMQSLVHREIELLDDLEAQVEDPDLLKGLFTVDHLATRMRRQSESLAVLGGSTSRRQWTRQVTMHEVLRAAVAEVEQYSRVKVVPPVEGVLRGAAVTDVIHLIAELVENATKFSAPNTTALLRAQHVSAGLAIEIEDRGLGIPVADKQRMNDLLTDPGSMDIDELLRDGRIGLYVVAALASRHGIKVRLQNNIYGGTQAVVVLPKQLLEVPAAERALPRGDFGEEDGSAPRLALVPVGSRGTGGGAAGGGAVSGGAVSGGAVSGGSAGAADGGAQPTRRPSSGEYGASEAPAVSAASRAPQVPVTDGAQPGAQADAQPPAQPDPQSATLPLDRPPLPRRQAQPGSAAQPFDGELFDGQPFDGRAFDDRPFDHHRDELGRVTEPPADQMTGLMADFLRGVSRAEEEDSPARD